jgi:hypothetical protein
MREASLLSAMLGLRRKNIGALLCMIIGVVNIQLLLYAGGFFDNADYFALFKLNLFAIYGYYGGFLIFEFFNKQPRDD